MGLGTFESVVRPETPHLGTLHVIGGRQRSRAGLRDLDPQWYGYSHGVIVEVTDGETSTVVERTSEPGTCGPEDPELFKSATLVDGRLYACSQTEIIVYQFPDLTLLHHVSLPMFNDVHHVVPARDSAGNTDPSKVWVAVSGQDLVAEVSLDGELLSTWGVDGSDPSERIDPERDYRINTKLKPHAFHPNHLFYAPDGTLWVTRFETRDAVQVGAVDRKMVIGGERCHDGVVNDGLIHFTTVDAKVVSVDPDTLAPVAQHELKGSSDDTLLGWCRGLTFIDDVALVGFSRFRHTKVRGALSWVRNGLTQAEPTRVAIYDRHTWDLLEEIDLEPAGCNAVFSIIDGSGNGSIDESVNQSVNGSKQ